MEEEPTDLFGAILSLVLLVVAIAGVLFFARNIHYPIDVAQAYCESKDYDAYMREIDEWGGYCVNKTGEYYKLKNYCILFMPTEFIEFKGQYYMNRSIAKKVARLK